MPGTEHPLRVAGTIAVLVLLITTSTQAERPKYRIQALEPYPGEHIVWARPEALNNQNVAAGDSEGPIETRATRWHPDGETVGLDQYAFPRSRAMSINGLNWVAGLSYYSWDAWEAAI
jgi:hypothetical protein